MGEACGNRKGTGRGGPALAPRHKFRESDMADEKEVIVTTDRGGGGGAILAVVLLIALVVVLFLLFGRGMLDNEGTDIKADIKVDTPAKNN
jgi:hypothetical protein